MLRATAYVLAALALLTACGREPANVEPPVTLSADVFDAVARKRIVFAHQSVGNEVLKGVATLADGAQRKLSIVETRDIPQEGTGLFHFKVGENGNPKGKLADFFALLSESTAAPDVALIKLCYIDFNESTDGTALAAEYIATLDRLKQARPSTHFVPVTAPLTTIQTGPKAWIKQALGKQPAGYEVNARRNAFNEALRARYDSNDLFDIAALQRGQTITVDGKQVAVLDPSLTYDGGHLNDEGQRKVAAALLQFLAQLPSSANERPQGS
jgi:lysophospholipase L1-like esterase